MDAMEKESIFGSIGHVRERELGCMGGLHSVAVGNSHGGSIGDGCLVVAVGLGFEVVASGACVENSIFITIYRVRGSGNNWIIGNIA